MKFQVMNLFVETIQMYSLKELMQNAILICHSIVIYCIILYCICKKKYVCYYKIAYGIIKYIYVQNMLFAYLSVTVSQ